MMQDLVGHRADRAGDGARARGHRPALRSGRARVGVAGNREYNPGWHTALDLDNLLTVSEAITRAAIERQESRGRPFPRRLSRRRIRPYAKFNIVIRKGPGGEMQLSREPIPDDAAGAQAASSRSRSDGFAATALKPDLVETGAVEEKAPPARGGRARRAGPPSGSGAAIGTGGSSWTTPPTCLPGMVVLDAIHQIQAEQANDLAVRWNCKAGKCGSCSAEVNGMPKLMCMTRLSELPLDKPVTRRADARVPAGQGPGDRRLLELPGEDAGSSRSSPGRRTRPTAPGGWPSRTWTGCRSSGSASSASSARTSATCCATTSCTRSSSGRASWCHVAALEMHPLDVEDRVEELRRAHGIGYCNITKCCTKVCPEHITITDNAIIPLKERVVDEFFDPLGKLVKVFSRREDP